MTLQLALYKGPPDRLRDRLVHWLICAFTLSRYSHVELVIDGVFWSSSYRDGGVRAKRIPLDSGHWDLLPLLPELDAGAALRWFQQHENQRYDWMGVLRFLPVLAWLPRRGRRWFCSEAVAAALGLPDAHLWTPQLLADFQGKPWLY